MKKVLFIFVLSAFGLTGFSQTTTWTGGTNNDWATAGNWDNGIPAATDDITIPYTTNSQPEIAAGTDAVAQSITINGTDPDIATLTVNGTLTVGNAAGTSLTLSNTFSQMIIGSTGQVTCTGEITNSGDVTSLVIKSVTHASQGNLTGSLIYTNTGTEPDATVQVYVKEGGWHFVSSPIGNTIAEDFLSPIDDVWLSRFTAAQEWKYLVDTDTIIDKGLGYAYVVKFIAGRDDNNVSFTGKLVSKQFNTDLHYNDDGDTGNDFNLIGNPFSAPIHLNNIESGQGVHVELSVWIWDQTLNSGSGGYQWAADADSADPVVPEMSPPAVAVGQGFFVRALQVGAQLDFDPGLRQHTSNVKFFKNASEEEISYMRITVSKDQKSDYGDVTFSETGTNGFDNGYDVSKMIGSEDVPHVYFVAEGSNYCRNHLQTLQLYDEHIVDMHFIAGEDGEQTLEANLDYLPDTDVYLEDLLTNNILNLNDNPVYVFDASKNDNPARFRLYFAYSPTDVGEQPDAGSDIHIYSHSNAVYIAGNSNNSDDASEIYIYDMFGREIYFNKTQLNNLTRIPVSVRNSYLVVKVATAEKVYTEKVFVK